MSLCDNLLYHPLTTLPVGFHSIPHVMSRSTSLRQNRPPCLSLGMQATEAILFRTRTQLLMVARMLGKGRSSAWLLFVRRRWVPIYSFTSTMDPLVLPAETRSASNLILPSVCPMQSISQNLLISSRKRRRSLLLLTCLLKSLQPSKPSST